MTEDTINLEVLVKGYQWQVKDVDKALTKLATDVQELAREVDEHKEARAAAQANLNALTSSQETLEQERESLYREHSRASFEQDTAKLQGISRRRVELDSELGKVRDDIRQLREVEDVDFSVRAAGLQLRKDELIDRLPKVNLVMQEVLEGLPDELKAFYETMQSDSQRLYQKHSAITVPVLYTSTQLAEEKKRRGIWKNTDPAFLREQERKRKQRENERKRNNINHNERVRRGGGPVHTGQEVREQEGTSLADMTLREATKV